MDDSELLTALEKYADSELPLDEVIAYDDLENFSDEQILSTIVEKIQNVSPNSNQKRLFTHELNESQWKLVERHLKEINADHCHRLLMLLLRLDVTVMSFFGSTRLEHLEDQIRDIHQNGIANLSIPKSAGICDLLVVEQDLLNIEKIKGNARTRVKNYTLEEAPPTRGRSQRLQAASGAANPISSYQGRSYHSGGGSRGRGGGQYRGRGKTNYSYRESLQNQVTKELNRQLPDSDGPQHKRNKK